MAGMEFMESLNFYLKLKKNKQVEGYQVERGV